MRSAAGGEKEREGGRRGKGLRLPCPMARSITGALNSSDRNVRARAQPRRPRSPGGGTAE
eukprot:30204-Heterocapsa_arctica.AAC.1